MLGCFGCYLAIIVLWTVVALASSLTPDGLGKGEAEASNILEVQHRPEKPLAHLWRRAPTSKAVESPRHPLELYSFGKALGFASCKRWDSKGTKVPPETQAKELQERRRIRQLLFRTMWDFKPTTNREYTYLSVGDAVGQCACQRLHQEMGLTGETKWFDWWTLKGHIHDHVEDIIRSCQEHILAKQRKRWWKFKHTDQLKNHIAADVKRLSALRNNPSPSPSPSPSKSHPPQWRPRVVPPPPPPSEFTADSPPTESLLQQFSDRLQGLEERFSHAIQRAGSSSNTAASVGLPQQPTGLRASLLKGVAGWL